MLRFHLQHYDNLTYVAYGSIISSFIRAPFIPHVAIKMYQNCSPPTYTAFNNHEVSSETKFNVHACTLQYASLTA